MFSDTPEMGIVVLAWLTEKHLLLIKMETESHLLREASRVVLELNISNQKEAALHGE